MTTSYTLLEGVLDVMLEKPELMSQVRLATFGDNRLLDFLPVKINSLPQQFELIADSAMELALNASAKRYKRCGAYSSQNCQTTIVSALTISLRPSAKQTRDRWRFCRSHRMG